MECKVPRLAGHGKPILKGMKATCPIGGGALVLLIAALFVSCDDNYFNKQYFRSTDYYFPDANLKAFARAAGEGKLDVLEALVNDKMVEVDQRGNEGMTALAWALGAKNLASVDWLLAHGANPDRSVYEATTMLTIAVFQEDVALVNRLLKSALAACLLAASPAAAQAAPLVDCPLRDAPFSTASPLIDSSR